MEAKQKAARPMGKPGKTGRRISCASCRAPESKKGEVPSRSSGHAERERQGIWVRPLRNSGLHGASSTSRARLLALQQRAKTMTYVEVTVELKNLREQFVERRSRLVAPTVAPLQDLLPRPGAAQPSPPIMDMPPMPRSPVRQAAAPAPQEGTRKRVRKSVAADAPLPPSAPRRPRARRASQAAAPARSPVLAPRLASPKHMAATPARSPARSPALAPRLVKEEPATPLSRGMPSPLVGAAAPEVLDAKAKKLRRREAAVERSAKLKADGKGLHAVKRLSGPLSKLLGRTHLSRVELTREAWKYIKSECDRSGRVVICNGALRSIVGQDEFSQFHLLKLLKPHILD